MAEATQIMFRYKEIAEMFVKQADIHEGYWGVVVRFGIQAMNISLNSAEPVPTAIVPVLEIGLQRESEMTPLAVDAAVINPAPKKSLGEKKTLGRKRR